MARLVDVMKENQILNRRQLPLVIDENLTVSTHTPFLGMVKLCGFLKCLEIFFQDRTKALKVKANPF